MNSNRTYSTDHFYAKPGAYTASVVIQDGDGGSGSQSFPVVVVGLPTVNAGQGQTLQEGGIASLAGASVTYGRADLSELDGTGQLGRRKFRNGDNRCGDGWRRDQSYAPLC